MENKSIILAPDNKQAIFRRKTLALLITASMLAACGGGGGGGGGGGAAPSDGNTDTGGTPTPGGNDTPPGSQTLTREQFESEFMSPAGMTGIWRFQSTIDTSYKVEFTGDEIDVVTDTDVTQVSAYSTDGSGVPLHDACLGTGPQPLDNLDEITDLASDPNTIQFCQEINGSTPQVSYIKTDDSHFGIDLYCGSQLYSSVDIQKISTSPSFDMGTLALSSVTFDDFNADNGICGSRLNLDTSTTSSNPFASALNQVFSDVTIVAPYGDSFVTLDMKFYRKGVATGAYTVTQSMNDATDTMASVTLRSPVFGGTDEVPDSVDATSGTVTIDTVTDLAVSGSVDLVMNNGDEVKGTFSINLQ